MDDQSIIKMLASLRNINVSIFKKKINIYKIIRGNFDTICLISNLPKKNVLL